MTIFGSRRKILICRSISSSPVVKLKQQSQNDLCQLSDLALKSISTGNRNRDVSVKNKMLRPEDLFYGTDGKPDAPIVCIGEAWGSEEALAELAFVGQSGQLLRQMLREADIDPSRVLFTNLVPSQPKKNDFTQFLAPGHGTGTYRGLNPKLELLDGLRRLYIQITAVPRTLIIACGNYPLWALTSVASVNK